MAATDRETHKAELYDRAVRTLTAGGLGAIEAKVRAETRADAIAEVAAFVERRSTYAGSATAANLAREIRGMES